MSGLNGSPGKTVLGKPDREFESRLLRNQESLKRLFCVRREYELLHIRVRFEQRSHVLLVNKTDELVPRQNFLTKKF